VQFNYKTHKYICCQPLQERKQRPTSILDLWTKTFQNISPFKKHIDVLVATHPDADHIGGFKNLMSKYSHSIYLRSFVTSDTKLFKEHEKQATQNTPHMYAYAGMKIVFKNNYTQRPNDTNDDAIKGSISYNDRDVEHDILFPDFTYLTNKIADCLERKKIRKNTNCKKLTKLDTNEMSVVMNISHGENNLLLTGDASKEVERYVYENYQDIFADWRGTTNDSHELTQDEQSKGESILKLGHHGSKTSTDPYVVGKLLPKYAVSSSVINNKFSHPDVSVLETVQEVGAEILRTDLLGSVNMVSNGEVWLQK
jgi:beta-lactamase superfamily II metal-dependent hydrolase